MAQKASPNSIGTPFIELQTIDSTNKYAMQLVHAGMAQHGMAVFAHNQTSGKGQRGKKWTSESNVNIALSIIIKPDLLQVYEQFYLSAAVALAAHHFLAKYAGEKTKIKWPNDLYWGDRKAGGILIESVIGSFKPANNNSDLGADSHTSPANKQQSSSLWQWAVIGIGININQIDFPEDLPNPVSLKQITGKNFEPIELAKELCDFINEQLDTLFNGKRIELIQQYNQYLYKLNEHIKLKKENRVFDVVINGVASSGKLMTTHTVDEEFDFGEVEWLIEKVK